ncbi:uncharacterized protein PADG_03229 [Paracoccidioides brasiliensis Pb18]|uniref:RecA family profile 1 domain-containing protein n=2 Tax=Paracoccidioides brasiliensis TaxID=121759 RepID=C1G7S4_PARBD|nr:uncharacterized protein PADG_03229 [Paracoccidioides brasiliensis Pb18]EEH47131.1 hypothetical protein PADG_03229 [Paracoccidioides brasiliensis Pb18]ODH46899.1 hypothetical protein GX48_06984 [Paracoccidioides brasiliensis]
MTGHEEDIAKFSSPEEARHRKGPEDSFRLFGDVRSSLTSNQERESAIPTGLPRLDAALALRPGVRSSPLDPRRSNVYFQAHPAAPTKGVRRGEITEVMGSRGVGKTAFAMRIAASVLEAGQKVVWIDTAGPMNPTRFKDILRRERNPKLPHNPSTAPSSSLREKKMDEVLNQLLYFHPPTLAHLLALISHPPKGFPPQDTGLIVIDSISSLFTSEYCTKLPRERKLNTTKTTRVTAETKEERTRWKIIGNLAMNLKKLAARLNCAVITINEMASRFREKKPAILHEALSGVTWDSGVATCIVLCWQWLPPSFRLRVPMKRVRFAEVVKIEKVGLVHDRAQRVIPFVIKTTGLYEFAPQTCGKALSISIRRPSLHLAHAQSKRKLDQSKGSLEARRKRRIDLAETPDIKVESSEEDEGINGTTPSESSLALLVKEEEGDEYEWLDEDEAELVPEFSDEEGVGSDDGNDRGNGNGDNSPRPVRAAEGVIDDDTVLLLQNIPDDEEFD